MKVQGSWVGKLVIFVGTFLVGTSAFLISTPNLSFKFRHPTSCKNHDADDLLSWKSARSTTTTFVTGSTSRTATLKSSSTDDDNNDDDTTTITRDMTSLKTWAMENGVQFAATNLDPQEQHDNDDDWGVSLKEDIEAQQVIMRVPKTLVLNSQHVLRDIYKTSPDLVQPGIEIVQELGYGNQMAEFVLFLKMLMEYELGSKSLWYPWIQSLPKTFDTGVCMDDIERECLPPFASALAEYEVGRLECFRQALKAIVNNNNNNDNDNDLIVLLKNVADNDKITKWAFNVVFTRCWKYAPDENNSDTKDQDIDFDRSDIVPLGDMFNHREPGNVVVQDLPNKEYVDFVLTQDTPASSALYLSYGMTNPYRFLIIFGFVYEEMPEIFCQVLFTNPSQEMINLGCMDRSKMVYRTQDGAISNSVWDSVLYSLLAQVPDEQSKFYQACVDVASGGGDATLKESIHRKYALEACLTLRNHVVRTLSELDKYSEKTNMYLQQQEEEPDKDHPRLPMIRKHIDFLQATFYKVKERLDRMAKDEKDQRMKNMSTQ